MTTWRRIKDKNGQRTDQENVRAKLRETVHPGRPKDKGHPPALPPQFRIPPAEVFARWMRRSRLGLTPRLSMAQLAHELGVRESTVSRIETGKTLPDLNLAHRIFLILQAARQGKLIVRVTHAPTYVRVNAATHPIAEDPPGEEELDRAADS